MSSRLNYAQLSPESYKALLALNKSVSSSSLEKSLIDLIKIRISQLNGCLFCTDMHIKEAKLNGERDIRLFHLTSWHESSLFTAKEKAALRWAELLTKLPRYGIEDEDFAAIRAVFSEQEVSDLSFVIGNMNVWNRFGVAFRPEAGSLDKVMGLDKALAA